MPAINEIRRRIKLEAEANEKIVKHVKELAGEAAQKDFTVLICGFEMRVADSKMVLRQKSKQWH
jgi:hypothetical protein